MNSTAEQYLKNAINHHLSGNTTAASKLYNKILIKYPDNLTSLVNQGAILMESGQLSDATHLFERVLMLAPKDIEALNNLGNCLQELGHSNKALEQFKKAHILDPNNSTVSGNLSRCLLRKGDYKSAIEILESAIILDPENIGLKFINVLALPVIPEDLNQLNFARKRQASLIQDLLEKNLPLTDPINEIGMTNFLAAYHGKNERKVQEQLAICYQNACPQLNFTSPHISQRRKQKYIRIGFVSKHLGNHTIGKLNQALITGLDKEQFQSYLFCPEVDKYKQKQVLDKFGQHINEIYFPAPTITDLRSIISKMELDILYYPDIGMDPITYFLSFSRLAPIQCVTWGHPITTGIPTIDYFISSELTELKLENNHYTEKLVRLKTFSTDYAIPHLHKSLKYNDKFNIKVGSNIYMCPQSLFKIHPDFDQILGNILRKDPKGELILLEGQHEEWAVRLKNRFKQTIPDVNSRIRFLPRLNGSDFLQCVSLADVILDTPHFCGGNTSYEALAVGKIVVTLPSRFMRGRLTLGLYRQMGINELIAKTAEDYVKIAIKYGTDEKERIQVEKRIRATRKKIFNTRLGTRAHEKFFIKVTNFNRKKST